MYDFLSSIFSHDALLELGVVLIYVPCFGAAVYGWRMPEAYAVAPELSTVTVVLYAQSIFPLIGSIFALSRAPLTSATIHGLFQLPEILVIGVALPVMGVIMTINNVRSYLGLPSNSDTWESIQRANLYAFVLCVVTNPITTYINHMVASYSLGQ
jgi:hypothetical protein